jgi:transglutaminase-like putative cysteine protease
MGVRTGTCTLATLFSTAAFTGVITGAQWVPPVMLIVCVIAATGTVGRILRLWAPLIVLAQFLVLIGIVVPLFSGKGAAGLLAGSGSIDALRTLLSHAMTTIRNGVPPVPATLAIQCLLTLCMGVVTILVDVIALALGVPAAAGLVLLTVFAVPSSLSKTMLPWWAFATAALGLAALLISGGTHAEETLRWRAPRRVQAALGRQAVGVTAIAAVIGLLSGVVFNGVGTQGRLPGAELTGIGATTNAIGLSPFASLRGDLTRSRPIDLFRVRGLPQSAYLRVLTLSTFDPRRGWVSGPVVPGQPADGTLPPPTGTVPLNGRRLSVEIDPISYRDPWLPLFGVPLRLSGIGQSWRYNPSSGIISSRTQQQATPYTEQFILPTPNPAALREATGPSEVSPGYLDTGGIPPQIKALASQITAKSATPFDKAAALNEYFTDSANGFSYSLQTAPPTTSDALVDFLFHGKRGYCQQFASSMAVLLRAIGIPSRVAVGFTSGSVYNNEHVITTSDAHAWVEAYFPGYGWVTFDPTPLADGRDQLPPYLQSPHGPRPAPPSPTPPAATVPPGPSSPPTSPGVPTTAPPAPGGVTISTIMLWIGGTLALLVFLTALPAGLRELRRQRRTLAVDNAVEGAAGIAWQEALDEFRDRRTQPAPTETARRTAVAFADHHQLDEAGARALRTLVIAVERQWYAPDGYAPDPAVPDALRELVASLQRTAPLGWREWLLPRSVLRLRD